MQAPQQAPPQPSGAAQSPLLRIRAGIESGSVAEVQAGVQEADINGVELAPNVRQMITQWLSVNAPGSAMPAAAPAEGHTGWRGGRHEANGPRGERAPRGTGPASSSPCLLLIKLLVDLLLPAPDPACARAAAVLASAPARDPGPPGNDSVEETTSAASWSAPACDEPHFQDPDEEHITP
ncbi:unnamed protein product [Prorocentrum cordatum]|nr:unnamed protein product [Polarella glacialis]